MNIDGWNGIIPVSNVREEMPMSKKEKYRFCIGDKNKHSSLTTIIPEKNDVYIVSKSNENQTKLSIHESGKCQYSFTSEYVKKNRIVERNRDRHLMEFELLPLSDRYEIVMSYIYLFDEICLDDEILKQDVTWIPAPKKNWCVEVVFCKGATFNPAAISDEYKYIRTIVLDNRAVFIALYRYIPINDELRENVVDTRKIVKEDKTKKNCEEKICASFGYIGKNEHRYNVEIYV